MGVIKNRSTGQHVLLNYEHVFGRSETQAKTVIKGGEISRSHATIRWKGHKWIIQDHSLNGTLVNQKLNKQSSSDLKEGDEIKFGLIDGGVWEIVNDDPPISFLQNTTIPEEVFALASRPGIATPDYEGVSFFLGRDSRWKAELAGMVIDLLDGGKIKLGETELVFIENDGFTTTINMGEQTSRARFIFLLSPDEERISVEIQENDWKMDMGERVHNYLLLVLARKLFEDIDQGLHYRDRGWIGMELVTEDRNNFV